MYAVVHEEPMLSQIIIKDDPGVLPVTDSMLLLMVAAAAYGFELLYI